MANDSEKNIGVLMLGAFALFMIGVLGTCVLPFFDSAINTPTETAKLKNYPANSGEARGRAVYIREGCHWCHSQSVRPVKADSKLGPVSVPGDYYYDKIPLIMTQRTGPDLTWVGSRYSPEWQYEHLNNPQKFYKGSIMPKYNYLSEQDKRDLVAYLMSLKPAPKTSAGAAAGR
ncbi:cbb3-type cytochrome c oxidase subunit II [Effusibacillus lacus]|uniref:Cytochrome c oxidase, cbb3-type subunit II n=1 Tax=Effusibacillus lacus TaxID=1348429 RepID=A0A292YJ06_9BACL|nr:cbb3-type cytochrome c oxidase subunit II [Effusibacillus lacus]TCS70086.1 cytochrome c oxidase cbb3-type subunit 2 [Effusibacillus lacus]GAX91077.1 cytochrome c oxidase, cbb3-type subunit II [Effusibacillus lacus]